MRLIKAVIFFLSLFFLLYLFFSFTREKEPVYDVVVSSYPIYLITMELVDGTGISVYLMLPPGMNSHTYEPSFFDSLMIARARLFIFTDENFEVWAKKLSAGIGKKEVAQADLGIDYIYTEGVYDPHVWLLPQNAKLMARNIAGSLMAYFPEHQDKISVNLMLFYEKMDSLHDEYSRGLSNCNKTEIIVLHPAYGYMSREYNFVQVPLVKSFEPQAEVSFSRMKELIDSTKSKGIKYVFSEPLVSSAVVHSLAREAGAEVLELNPMESYLKEDFEKRVEYETHMKNNLVLLRKALECGE